MDDFSEFLSKFNDDSERRVAAKMAQFEMDKKAVEVASLLGELEKVENENGINSLEYANICKVLKGVLDEERMAAQSLVANVDAVTVDFTLLTDNAVWICIYSTEESISYREQWLVECETHAEGSMESLYDIANTQVNAEVLRRTTDTSLKYKLAYVDPVLCYELVLSHFKPGLIDPETDLARMAANDDQKYAELVDYHVKKFTEILYTLCCEEYAEDNILYDFLMVLAPFIPELIISEIVDAADEHPFEEVTTEKAKQVYDNLVKKMQARQKEK